MELDHQSALLFGQEGLGDLTYSDAPAQSEGLLATEVRSLRKMQVRSILIVQANPLRSALSTNSFDSISERFRLCASSYHGCCIANQVCFLFPYARHARPVGHRTFNVASCSYIVPCARLHRSSWSADLRDGKTIFNTPEFVPRSLPLKPASAILSAQLLLFRRKFPHMQTLHSKKVPLMN